MTPGQVVAASRGNFRVCAPNECSGQRKDNETALLIGYYQAGEFDFAAYALFDKSKRLVEINLELKSPTAVIPSLGPFAANMVLPATEKSMIRF